MKRLAQLLRRKGDAARVKPQENEEEDRFIRPILDYDRANCLILKDREVLSKGRDSFEFMEGATV